MEIEFLDNKNNKRKITLPKKYSDFIDLLKKTFFISDERFDNISLFYFDGEDDFPLEEEDYTSKDARKATYWKLSENENEDDENNDTLSSAKEELMNYKTMILAEAKKFKDDLYKKYSKIAEEQIKEKNKKHEEEKEKIKKDYINNLKEFTEELGKQSKSFLDKVEEKLMSVYNEKIKIINEEVNANMKKTLLDLEKECQKELDNINEKDIENGIENMINNIDNCKSAFIDKFGQKKNKKALYEISDITLEKRMGEIKNGLEFNLPIKNRNNNDLDGTYILKINKTNNDKDNYQVELDLCNLKLNVKRDEKINFNPKIKDNGNYSYFLSLMKNDEIVSNISKLNLNVVEVGSNDDLFT